MTRTAITNDPHWPNLPPDNKEGKMVLTAKPIWEDLVTGEMVDAAFAVLFPIESWSDRQIFTTKLRVRAALEAALELKK